MGATLAEVVGRFPTSTAGTGVRTASGSDRIRKKLEIRDDPVATARGSDTVVTRPKPDGYPKPRAMANWASIAGALPYGRAADTLILD